MRNKRARWKWESPVQKENNLPSVASIHFHNEGQGLFFDNSVMKKIAGTDWQEQRHWTNTVHHIELPNHWQITLKKTFVLTEYLTCVKEAIQSHRCFCVWILLGFVYTLMDISGAVLSGQVKEIQHNTHLSVSMAKHLRVTTAPLLMQFSGQVIKQWFSVDEWDGAFVGWHCLLEMFPHIRHYTS